MKTREDIVIDAFRKLGIPGDGDDLTTDQEQAGNNALSSMIKTFQAHHGMPLWVTVEEEFALSLFSATGQATLGVSATLESTTKPLKIHDCWLVDYVDATAPKRVVMTRYEAERFNNLSSPLSAGTPTIWYGDKKVASYVMNVWPVPDTYSDTNSKIRIRYTKTVTEMVADTDTPDFPEHWEEAIIYGLAQRLLPEYGSSMERGQQIRSDAQQFLMIAESFDNEEGSVYFTVGQRR
jgi:hypothetical protein